MYKMLSFIIINQSPESSESLRLFETRRDTTDAASSTVYMIHLKLLYC